jgi:hypothetical protein
VAVVDHQKLVALHRATNVLVDQIVKGVDDMLAIVEQLDCHDFPPKK